MPDSEPETRPIGSAARPPEGSDQLTDGHATVAASTQAAEPVTPPQRIGRFSVIKVLGRGGMGVVYLARDARDKREVALKVIPAGPDADPTDLARFRTEAEAVARLDHPNIVKLFEVGEVDHLAFLSMEYVDGGSLYRRIKQGGPLRPIDAAQLVEQIARATHFAHINGVVHRDLKPSNILMQSPQSGVHSPQSERNRIGTADSRLGTPKLADFGLAKQLDKSLRLTQTGIAVGTPHYMSPEQARGQTEQIGPSADIHALGAILYELLVGYPPFGGGTPMETMQQVVDKKPVPPSQLRNGVPSDLEAICLMCLEKSPAKRYRTAEALADDLNAFLASGRPTNPDDPSIRIQATQRKNRWLVPAIAAMLGLLLFVAGGTWWLTSRAKRAEVDAAERAGRLARVEAAIAVCESGQVALGLEQLRALEPTADADGLPVREIIAAWEGRVLQPVTTQPELIADVLAISPHGRFIAAAEGPSVRVGKSTEWSRPAAEWNVDGSVTAMGWSEDGIHLAIATSAGHVFIGNAETGKLDDKPIVSRQDRTILAVGFAFPGVRLVYGGDVLQQEVVPPIPAQKRADANLNQLTGGRFVAAAIAPATGNIAAVLATGSVRVFDRADGRWRDLPPDGHATAIAYSSNGNVLIVGTRAGTVRIWDAAALVPLTDAATIGKPVAAVALGVGDTEYLAVACPVREPQRAAGTVWNCQRPFVAPPIRLNYRPGNEVLGVAFAPDGLTLFVTSPYGVSRWRVRDAKRYGPVRDYSAGDRYGQPASQEARFSAGTIHPAGQSVLVGGSGGRMFLIDADKGDTLKHAPGGQNMTDVTAVATGKDGRTASASRIGVSRTIARHWDRDMDGDPRAREFHCDINQETFLPDGSAVVLACGDGKVRIWEPAADHVRTDLECQSPVMAVAVSSDGSRLLAGCADGTARLWDLENGKELRAVRHRAEVRAVAFHNGNLVTAGGDGTVRRWHADTGLPLGPPLAHADAVTALAVWGDLIASGGRDRYVRVWRVP